MTDPQATCEHNDHNKNPGHCTICQPGFVMADTTAKAREIYEKLLKPKTSLDWEDPVYFIAAAIEAERQAGFEEGFDARGAYEFTKLKAKHTKYFNEGLEEAAKIVEEVYKTGTFQTANQLADRIRRLKGE
jgi:hypothetical protein